MIIINKSDETNYAGKQIKKLSPGDTFTFSPEFDFVFMMIDESLDPNNKYYIPIGSSETKKGISIGRIQKIDNTELIVFNINRFSILAT